MRRPLPIAPVAAAVGVAVALAACSSNGSPGGGSSASSTSTPTSIPPLNFNGNTSDVPSEIAQRLGCIGFADDDQLDNYTSAEATCLYQGDNSITIYAFSSSQDEQSWFNLGPESANETGTVVLGSEWAVAPYNTSQADEIAQVLGGKVEQEP